MAPKYKSKTTRKDSGKPRLFHGKNIIDATESLDLVITESDRKKGVILDLQKCAAGQAIMRTFHPIDVRVGRSVILIEYADQTVRYHTPAPIRDQLLRFDASHDHKEFTAGKYTLLPVPQSKIKSRGKRHSEPDRVKGDPNNKRIKRTLNGEKGRPEMTYSG